MTRTKAIALAGVGLALLLGAGLVSAQTPPTPAPGQDLSAAKAAVAPVPGVAAPATPPAPVADPLLPPEETAPAKISPSPDKPAADDAKDKGDDADTAKSEDDVTPPPPPAAPADPAKRVAHGGAIFQALDKITAETIRFEVREGGPVRWKGLIFTVRACETSASDEPQKDSLAYVQVRSEARTHAAVLSREVFRGWMVASAPGLNPLQHPVYDAWLVACSA